MSGAFRYRGNVDRTDVLWEGGRGGEGRDIGGCGRHAGLIAPAMRREWEPNRYSRASFGHVGGERRGVQDSPTNVRLRVSLETNFRYVTSQNNEVVIIVSGRLSP